MKSSFCMLAAIAVVCVLAVVLRTPYALASTPVATTETTDRDVLVALYHATDGDNWSNNDNWLSDAPIGTWYGVTTDESGRVIELGLAYNNLSGTIPPELSNLTALTNLYLSWNQLSRTIPPELSNLTALTNLNLGWNQLSGTVPPELGNLANLDALYLAGNRLRGCLPAVWKYVVENDLEQLDLPFCAAVPLKLSAAAARDRDALVALYWAADGDKWTNNDNWLSDAPLGTWYGVTADANGRVIELDLWHNDLSGTIPPELGNLTALTSLSLSSNDLSGTIPSELGKLTALTNLYLRWNQLSGTIPPELSNLTALTNLYLGWNQLSGTVPPELDNLANLDALYLAGNRLRGCLPAVWKYVVENDLERLDLPFCAAASSILSAAAARDRDVLVALYWAADGDKWTANANWLSDAPVGTWYGVTTDDSGRVIELVLWFNNLRGTIPPELGNLTALTELRLNGNNLRGTVPPELGNLTALTALNLSKNQLSGTVPPELGNLTALTALNLSKNQLSGTVPPELGNLGNLDTLYLAGNQLTGCQLAQLAVWKYVVENDLDQLGLPYCVAATDRDVLVALYWAADGDKWTNNDNWLSDAPVGTWYGVTANESGRVIGLDLWHNNLRGTVPPELGNLTALTALRLSSNDLSGTVPPELSNLTALTNLDLGWNQLSGTVPPELGNLANLDALYLAGNRLRGCLPAVWKYVVENDLERLDLPYCVAATSAHSTDGDRDVLVALYLATDGDKWTNNDNWLSDAPLGTWYGVTTDESGRVIKLVLWFNNLSGTKVAQFR